MSFHEEANIGQTSNKYHEQLVKIRFVTPTSKNMCSYLNVLLENMMIFLLPLNIFKNHIFQWQFRHHLPIYYHSEGSQDPTVLDKQ